MDDVAQVGDEEPRRPQAPRAPPRSTKACVHLQASRSWDQGATPAMRPREMARPPGHPRQDPDLLRHASVQRTRQSRSRKLSRGVHAVTTEPRPYPTAPGPRAHAPTDRPVRGGVSESELNLARGPGASAAEDRHRQSRR
jgi:hypothetical protein